MRTMDTIQNEITCDFTPPEADLQAFRHHIHRESLADMVDAARYDSEPTPEYETQLVANLITAVRSTMKYRGGVKAWFERSEGDCWAYAWLLSDVVEAADLTSRIVFVNDHVFNLILDRTGQVHIASSDIRGFHISDVQAIKVNGVFSQDAWSQMSEVDDSGVMLVETMYTDHLQAYTRNVLEREYPAGHGGTRLELSWLDDQNPAATIMRPDTAKQALFTYYCFIRALQNGNIDEVFAALCALEGCNPQQETRKRINGDMATFHNRVKGWANDESTSVEQVVATIRAYEKSMPETKSMKVFVGDCTRLVGSSRAVRSLLEVALDIYSTARRLSKPTKAVDKTLEGKVNKTRGLLNLTT